MDQTDIVKAAQACKANKQSLVTEGKHGGFYCRTPDNQRYVVTQEGVAASFDESIKRCAGKLDKHDVQLCANQDFSDFFRHILPINYNINLQPKQR